MKAITIWPEWAFAITHLGKRVENRSWSRSGLAGSYIAIHAGASFGGGGGMKRAQSALDRMIVAAAVAGWSPKGLEEVFTKATAENPCADSFDPAIHVGAFVATARVVQVRRPVHLAPWETGPLCWELDDVRRLVEPIPAKGRQGLWPMLREHQDAIADAKAKPAGGGAR